MAAWDDTKDVGVPGLAVERFFLALTALFAVTLAFQLNQAHAQLAQRQHLLDTVSNCIAFPSTAADCIESTLEQQDK